MNYSKTQIADFNDIIKRSNQSVKSVEEYQDEGKAVKRIQREEDQKRQKKLREQMLELKTEINQIKKKDKSLKRKVRGDIDKSQGRLQEFKKQLYIESKADEYSKLVKKNFDFFEDSPFKSSIKKVDESEQESSSFRSHSSMS